MSIDTTDLRTPAASAQAGAQPVQPGGWLRAGLLLLPLAFLWWRLIDHLRVEWAVNPQYAYGWAVPFLCAYLLWQRIRDASRRTDGSPDSATQRRGASSQRAVFYLLLFSLALLYLPTRLVQEANPDWRLVSWALALIVIGVTLLFLHFDDSPLRRFNVSTPSLIFPILFFLVAVPWPTLIEGPLIQALAHWNAGSSVEVLGWLGIPALRHGTTIEIASGVVGVDEACSGIRSFQATLMIALFLGEIYSLTRLRRVFLCLGGFILAFVFNIGRTSLLTYVASAKGIPAISAWHDPAGITILVACFVSLWIMALALKSHSKVEPRHPLGSPQGGGLPQFVTHHSRFAIRLSAFLLAWLLLVEGGVEWWYRSHETGFVAAPAWQVQMPRDNTTFRELPFTDVTRQFLRYDEGLNGVWTDTDARRWQMIYFRWKPGRIGAHVARSHTPEVCLTAAGREMIGAATESEVQVGGLTLPFQQYAFTDPSGPPLHVFYCFWQDQRVPSASGTQRLDYATRLAPVLAGRRNSGQRSLEIAVWGFTGLTEAKAAVARELEKLLRPEQTSSR